MSARLRQAAELFRTLSRDAGRELEYDRAGVAWGPCETVAGALEDPQVLASCPPQLVRTAPPCPVIR